jgi:hypothetical protein
MMQAASADDIIFAASGSSKMVIGYGEPGYDELKVEYGAEPDVKLTSENAEAPRTIPGFTIWAS